MPRPKRKQTENLSVSLKSSTIELLENFCSLYEIDNRSSFIDEAVCDAIFREMGRNPVVKVKAIRWIGGVTS